MNQWLWMGVIVMWGSIAQAQSSNAVPVRTGTGSDLQIFDTQQDSWLDIETFWMNYAQARGGLTWGRTAVWPDYDQLSEGDTLMIEVEGDVCLMEFFHQRWRRANDVRRWNDALNDHAGCPNVFD